MTPPAAGAMVTGASPRGAPARGGTGAPLPEWRRYAWVWSVQVVPSHQRCAA
jgi:hypothetical protein